MLWIWIPLGIALVAVGIAVSIRRWEISWPAAIFAASGVCLLVFHEIESFSAGTDGVSLEKRVETLELHSRFGWVQWMLWYPALGEENRLLIHEKLESMEAAERIAFESRLKAGLDRHAFVTLTDLMVETLRALDEPELAAKLYKGSWGASYPESTDSDKARSESENTAASE